MHSVTVIFPTLARSDRAASLHRAIDSVLAQEQVRVVPLVVINGDDRDPALVRQLTADSRLRVVSIAARGIPEALRAGRALVDTEWFSRLDDDDLMLPGALALRLAVLEAEPHLDAVVTNGFRRNAAGDALHVTDVAAVRRDPLRALLAVNWLLPGSWLCRSERIGAGIFEGAPHSLECTYLAVRLASEYRMAFLDQPTVVWHTDLPTSESKSREWRLNEAGALEQILALDLPEDFRDGVRRKVSRACHSVSYEYLKEGNPGEAWRWHVRSLRGRGGWRYLMYSRRVLAGLILHRSP